MAKTSPAFQSSASLWFRSSGVVGVPRWRTVSAQRPYRDDLPYPPGFALVGGGTMALDSYSGQPDESLLLRNGMDECPAAALSGNRSGRVPAELHPVFAAARPDLQCLC